MLQSGKLLTFALGFFKIFEAEKRVFASNPVEVTVVADFFKLTSEPEILYSGDSFKRFTSDRRTPSRLRYSVDPNLDHGLWPVRSSKLSAIAFPICRLVV